MQSVKSEQSYQEIAGGVERFREDVTVLKAQLARLEQEKLRTPLLLRKLGEYFGFGAASKLEWVRFKLKYKQEELERC